MWQAQGRSSNVKRNWNLTHIITRQHTHTHTHYLPSPRCAASVKAEALKCKRFMKFIYVPVKMPTATESRRERERGGRWEVYLGQANITFPSTGSGCHHNFSLLRRSRKRICDKTHSSRPRPTTSLPPVPSLWTSWTMARWGRLSTVDGRLGIALEAPPAC